LHEVEVLQVGYGVGGFLNPFAIEEPSPTIQNSPLSLKPSTSITHFSPNWSPSNPFAKQKVGDTISLSPSQQSVNWGVEHMLLLQVTSPQSHIPFSHRSISVSQDELEAKGIPTTHKPSPCKAMSETMERQRF